MPSQRQREFRTQELPKLADTCKILKVMSSKTEWIPPADGVQGKILHSLEDVRLRVERLKSEGKRVVFTNGGFDILHVGHTRSLRHARSLGDTLVVGVNSDRSIRKAKGSGRPLFPAAERVEIVASLDCTGTVFVFDDDTADATLQTLQPHVHAKGPDYSLETVPERATVMAYGGEIAIVGDPKDHSSTEIHRRMTK
jgi:rfaE bifunctional protein nucleotidyltransferase chain/domain